MENNLFFWRLIMKLSARNMLLGKVTKVAEGPVSAEIEISLKGGGTVVAVITHDSRERLGIKPGIAATAIIKAPSIIIAKDLGGARLSARNVLHGKIEKLVEGKVNAEVDIRLPGGDSICAVITDASLRNLDLKMGDDVAAVFKANSVIVGVD
jgi:molybdate transport system regulatory protein